MTSLPPSPPELIARFSEILDRFPHAERRKMFGFPAAFVGGNLATGLYGDGWMVRLSGEDLARGLTATGATLFEPMPGRTMKGYLLLPTEVVVDDGAMTEWVGRALAYAGGLPPKG